MWKGDLCSFKFVDEQDESYENCGFLAMFDYVNFHVYLDKEKFFQIFQSNINYVYLKFVQRGIKYF